MKPELTRRGFLAATAAAVAATGVTNAAETKPVIKKLGTIKPDTVETSPVVFKNKLYRFEYVRQAPIDDHTVDSCFQFVYERDKAIPGFAFGMHLGSAAVFGDLAVVTAVNKWGSDRIAVLTSNDLKNWKLSGELNLPGYGIFNTSLCKAPTGTSGGEYVLMFEIDKPAEIAGQPFTARFAKSSDLKTWTLTPPECNYAKDRYTAPHCLRHLDGYFYNFYLEAVKGGYEQYVVRSKDLVKWEQSPLNPVLKASDEDKQIANENLTEPQREKIGNAKNINNSDIDFCEFEGRLVINYSWGNQQGIEFLAEAEYDGTEAEFLKGWFPA